MSNLPPGFVLDNPAPQGGPVLGPPPKGPAPISPGEAQRIAIDRRGLELREEEAGYKRQEQADKVKKFKQARRTAIDTTINVLRQLDRIDADVRDNGGFGETGRSGAFVRGLPNAIAAGTAGYDLQKDLNMIDANNAFSALQTMRDNSPTGGALGAITAPELELLKSTISSLDPNQSQENFLRAVNDAREAYVNALRRVRPEAAEAYTRIRSRQGGGQRKQSGGGAKFLGFE